MALLTSGDPGSPLIERVCEVSAALLGVTGAGMCLIGGRHHQVVVHGTSHVAEELEDLQLELGQGPCMQAVRTGTPTLVADLLGHRTMSWPVFAKRARARGVRALFSFPLESGTTTLGALDLYRDTRGPLTAHEQNDAATLAAIATQAMLAQQDRVHLDGTVTALHWLATAHRFGTSTPSGGLTRGRAVDLGLTVEDALPSLWEGVATRAPAASSQPGVEPADRPAPAGSPASDDVLPVTSPTGDSTPGRQVLVVDDEPGMRLVLGRALGRLGYRVLLADSVDAGIARLVSHPGLAAVIVDVVMPSAAGLDFAAAVVTHHPGIPMLFLTDGATASGALDDSLIGLVSKPVAVGDLHVRLEELIGRADQWSVTTATPATQAMLAFGDGALMGLRNRRIEPGGRLSPLPELDHVTASWAAVSGLAGLGALSAVPGSVESTRVASLGRFAAGVANEVNNMLAVVSMHTDLLAEGEGGRPSTGVVAEDLTAIAAAVSRASALLGQLMLFTGQRTLDRGTVDVAGLVEALRPRLDELAGGPGVIAYTVERVTGIVGDHEHLERVLTNLVANALEATASSIGPLAERAVDPALASTPGRVWITVRPGLTGGEVAVAPAVGSSGDALGPGVVIEVGDSGRGMSEEVLVRAGEPFYRAYTSGGGSGLGLSIVHGIVSQHGGWLEVDSAPGEGTTVRVTLPAEPRSTESARAARPDG